MLWEEITSGQFEAAVEASKGVCAVVVGCLEQHGHHLPMGQDVIFTAGIAERAGKPFDACVSLARAGDAEAVRLFSDMRRPLP